MLCHTMHKIITRLLIQVEVYVFSHKTNCTASTQYTQQQSRNVIGKCVHIIKLQPKEPKGEHMTRSTKIMQLWLIWIVLAFRVFHTLEPVEQVCQILFRQT